MHPPKLRQTFEPDPSSARAARVFVGDALASWGFGGDVDTVLLLASEVVSNAVRHAGTRFDVEVRLEGEEVTVSVLDGSGDQARVKAPTPSATTGRGMFIVEQLATAWGAEPTPHGKSVWFTCR